MTADELRQARRSEPFVPFTLVLKNGCRIDIPHPSYLGVAPGVDHSCVAGFDDGTYQVVPLSAISKLDFRAPVGITT